MVGRFLFKVVCDVLELNRRREMPTECFSVAYESFGIGRLEAGDLHLRDCVFFFGIHKEYTRSQWNLMHSFKH